MENVRPKRRALLPLVFACATVGLMMAKEAAAQNNSSLSWWPFGQSNNGGSKNSAQSTTPSASPADDPISLKTPAKAGVELYVAVANLYIQSGKFTEAEEQYQQAMKSAPTDIRVLLGYAMLKDQMNQPEEALKFYQQAEKKHPKQPSVYNNLAVHYVRRGMVGAAIEAARHAVDLRPSEPRYRNNLAALLVEAGSPQEAFKQLRAVYDEPIAHYDLGFLLNKRGLKAAALQEFTIALTLSPGMTLARQWVERLSRERGESSPTTIGMMPLRGQFPAGVAPNPISQHEGVPSMPMAPSPPQFAAPPQYVAPPQYPNQAPPPAQVQYPAQTPAPGQMQYPAGPPQYVGTPQYRNSVPSSPPAVNSMPTVASRDQQATGVRVVPTPAGDGNALRRLPPVNDPGSNRAGQGADLVAPDPPDWRR
ncbi:MAG: tetratricopeptide repeat protein [Thermoguttaceae bacterium]